METLMAVIHVPRESHAEPMRFRIKHEDAMAVLGPKVDLPKDTALPVLCTQSAVSIIGAGFAGIASSLMVKDTLKTEDFCVFDKHAQWGGTWWANTYPGCASDIPAPWYSIFAELNDNWSALRPPQYEMEEYILQVVNKHGLDKYARFERIITKVVYSDDSATWKLYGSFVKTGQLFEHTSKIVLSAQGGLVYPQQLDVPGLKEFKGQYMHSALWNHNVDFKGKNVVVVGNGCLAAQVVPALVDQMGVKSVVQVFRSKHWILPPPPAIAFWLYKHLSRTRIGLAFVRYLIVAIAELRYPLYQGNGFLSRLIRWQNTRMCRNYIEKAAPKKYHDMLIPDFKIGCKRIIYDYKYIPTLNDSRVELNNSGIDHITESTVVLKDGTVLPADIIVACTGYSVPKSFFLAYELIGSNGLNVQEMWKREGVSAYKTYMVRDAPNYFYISGPNSATGHFSVVSAIENGCAFVSRVVPKVLDGTYKSVRVKRSAYYDWFQRTQDRLSKAVFGTKFGGCVSWYSDDGVNATAYPYSQVHAFITSRVFGKKDFLYETYGDQSAFSTNTKKTV